MPIPILPRRRCDNCGVFYRPKQRLKKNDKHGFCNPACKKQFHKHGGSFAKLKPVIEAEVRKRIKILSPADGTRMQAIEDQANRHEAMWQALKAALDFCGAVK